MKKEVRGSAHPSTATCICINTRTHMHTILCTQCKTYLSSILCINSMVRLNSVYFAKANSESKSERNCDKQQCVMYNIIGWQGVLWQIMGFRRH